MQSEAVHTAAETRASTRKVWASPRVKRLAASEAELAIVGGPDAEMTS